MDSLFTDTAFRDNLVNGLVKGQSYDYGGEGLQFEEGGSEVPFGSDPLSTLNRGRERQP